MCCLLPARYVEYVEEWVWGQAGRPLHTLTCPPLPHTAAHLHPLSPKPCPMTTPDTTLYARHHLLTRHPQRSPPAQDPAPPRPGPCPPRPRLCPPSTHRDPDRDIEDHAAAHGALVLCVQHVSPLTELKAHAETQALAQRGKQVRLRGRGGACGEVRCGACVPRVM